MKTLILYYSYSGNTKRIAEMIQKEIGGDIVRMDTVVPYDGDYDTVVNQGQRENAAMHSCLKQTDLTGKIVYPFATNGGWLGHTLKDFEKACKGAIVKPGLGVRFDESTLRTPEKEIRTWIKAIHG